MARYAIEPQRDLFKDSDTAETRFVLCDEDLAEHFAVYRTGEEQGDAELIEDFATRAEAEAFIAGKTRPYPSLAKASEIMGRALRTPTQRLQAALDATGEAAKAYTAASRKASLAGLDAYRAFEANERIALDAKTRATIGRVTIIANVGGNTVRQHVRHTFKIDGKRASRAQAEAILLSRS